MPPKQKTKISVGDKFGSLTVLNECGRNKHRHLQYMVKCDCGKEYMVDRARLFRKNPRCIDCAEASGYRHHTRKPEEHHAGEIIRNWLLLEKPSRKNNSTLYTARAKCLSCGNISVIASVQLKQRKQFKCVKCPPDYDFKVDNGTAVGILPDGTAFKIDAEDIPLVSRYWWHKESDGYIISNDNKPALRLHNFIIGFNPSENKRFVVDHINRDACDCRKSNLRIVTAQQNAMNTSIIRSSSTGLRGVTFDKKRKKYISRIGLNDKRIYLGSSVDPVVCAQMYNWAAPIIFGKFARELNDVPEPPAWIKQKIEEKCKPYMYEAAIATQSCGDFFAQSKGA